MLAKLHSLGHHISATSLREIADKGMSAINRLQKAREKAQEQMGHVIQTLEVNATAFGFGFVRGAYAQPGQDVNVMGVPVDLAAGLAGHAVAMFGGLGRYETDMHNLSDGALASYTTALGLSMGVKYSQNHPANAAAATHGVGWGLPHHMHRFHRTMGDADLASFVSSATR